MKTYSYLYKVYLVEKVMTMCFILLLENEKRRYKDRENETIRFEIWWLMEWSNCPSKWSY